VARPHASSFSVEGYHYLPIVQINTFTPIPSHSATDSLSDLVQRFITCSPLLGGPKTFFHRGLNPLSEAYLGDIWVYTIYGLRLRNCTCIKGQFEGSNQAPFLVTGDTHKLETKMKPCENISEVENMHVISSRLKLRDLNIWNIRDYGTVFLKLFEPRPRLGQLLCLATPGVRTDI
jgi:hypothetical protein